MLYFLVSVVEFQLIISIIPLWLLAPGIIGMPWLCFQIAAIWCLIRAMNRERRVFTSEYEVKYGRNTDWDCCSWIVVGGMECCQEFFRKNTCPRLGKLFGNDVEVFLPYRLGLPLDLVVLYAQRTCQIPTPLSTELYKSVRAHCLKSQAKRMNILVHNTGALDMAWVMARLCSDLPPGQMLGKFHVYTFGSAASEMVIPLGAHNGHEGHTCNCENFPELPLVNHFAFEDDPFAQIGVLWGVRHRMEGRLVGAVYAIQRHTEVGWNRWLGPGAGCSMDDYLDALFPDGNPRAGVLGQVCRIERDVSEMREMAALARAFHHHGSTSRRQSWTILGLMADSPSNSRNFNHEMAGIVSLEETRRAAKAAEGMLGYERNTLAGYVIGKHRLTRDEVQGERRSLPGSISPRSIA
ncbi:hypothetical protein JX265_010792 [Neoarthrinium moseri]|uniref:Uncharacterized protein n=1 Tax=Neoarthrinium moseri TaxID=1658444 RepID=A0A9P9WD61_9PEZI|nr:uncharacterized protein JN550_010642 [Neoarthrinium moseri]KAI1840212.1 hypothetical protein JX266_013579 [Neoarthrinium moseri]KAI1858124.1 hypothetical protein JX265_010792 [Neoarthrinium moseri]KAI1862011.1 hypothetical protein JN550_010642 [Neoarthrinium moseri]